MLKLLGANKIIVYALIFLGSLALIATYNNYQQKLGAAKLENKLKSNDEKTLKDKEENDKELRSFDDERLLREFLAN